jgi:putative RecB family exonuclease
MTAPTETSADTASGATGAVGAGWEVPTSLSPSRVESFLSCPLAFRFSSIEKLPDPPTAATTRGSLVHRALELLFLESGPRRTADTLDRCVEQALAEYRDHPDFTRLGLDEAQTATFDDECRALAANYLTMEDPTTVRDIGLELRLEASVGDLTLRGIIDRLELDSDGELVVTDYKTGRAPSPNWERKSLSGVHFYAFLCESLFGRRPAAIRLMYLKSGETITATPSAQSTRFMTTRTTAVWKAVATACERDDFRPRRSALCDYCAYQRWCPEFGGEPARAAHEAPVALDSVAAA